jgi:enterochelin esterase-like enzyme
MPARAASSIRCLSLLLACAACGSANQDAPASGGEGGGQANGGVAGLGGAGRASGGDPASAGVAAALSGGAPGSAGVDASAGRNNAGGSSGSGGSGGPSLAGSATGGGATAGASGASGASGAVSSDGDGDFKVGPTYSKSPDLMSKGAPAGASFHFSMSSASSQIFQGTDSTLLPENQHSFTRGVDVYIPAKYKAGVAAPFMIIQDGPGALSNIKLALDNLTQSADSARRLPAFIAIAVASGGGDSIGSERGLEYDTLSDRYARFVQNEVLPAVLADSKIKAAYPNLSLTTDPDGRGAIGCSSGGAAALAMGWFRPEWFRRIVTYSGTFVAQQNPAAPEHALFPDGAWDYHSDLKLIAMSELKPLRIFINANEKDNGYDAAESGRHNWLMANQRTASALKARGYHYRFVEGLGASHCQGSVQDLTLPDALLWVWRGYPVD